MLIDDIKQRFDRIKSLLFVKREFINNELLKTQDSIAQTKKSILKLNEATNVLTKIAELSRRDTINKIENLITYALQHIFDDSYKFFIEEKESNNNVIYEFMVKHGSLPPFPIKRQAGGGIYDVVGVFLCILISIIHNPLHRRFFILDERFRGLSRDFQPKVAKVLRYFADKLNIQFIIISHQKTEFAEIADIAYEFQLCGDETKVKVLLKPERDID